MSSEHPWFQTWFESSPIGGCVLGLDGRVQRANRALADMLDRSVEELVSLSFEELTHPEGRGSLSERLQGLREGTDDEDVAERRLLARSGRGVPARVTIRVVREPSGEPAGLLVHVVDLRELRRVEGALGGRDRMFAQMNALTADLASLPAEADLSDYVVDRLMRMSGATAAVFNEYDPEERALFLRRIKVGGGLFDKVARLLGSRVTNLRSPVDDEAYREITSTVVGRRETLTEASFGTIPRVAGEAVKRLIGADFFLGLAHIIEGELYGTTMLALRADRPELPGELLESYAYLVAVSLRRRRAEKHLAEGESRWRRYVESAPYGVFIADRRGHLREVNPEACRLTGYSASELLGKDVVDMMAPEARAEGRQLLRRLTRFGEAQGEIEFLHHDGEKRWCSLAAVRLTPTHYLGFVDDITEKKRVTEQLWASQKMESVGRLAGGVAHDFNNLLMVILGCSEMALELLSEGDPLRGMLEEIYRSGERAAALTRQLLAFSRRQVLKPEVLDLNQVLTDLEKLLRRLIGEDLELLFRPAPDLWKIKADRGQVEQVVMNLAVNARDAMPDGGLLTIETRNVELDGGYVRRHMDVEPGEHVMVAVSDNGQGMDKETAAQIFEPFFTTKGKNKGTGLGLATVYGIVKQTGGRIEVYSEVGRGTTFRLYFPRVRDALAVRAPRAAKPGVARGSETVLVVEDEEAVRNLTEKILGAAGYRVLTAADGREALRLSQEATEPVDLLLTDVIMPDMGGRELAARVALQHPRVKVLYMSGYTDNAIVRHGVLEPNTHFIGKPFSREELTRQIRALLDELAGEERPPDEG